MSKQTPPRQAQKQAPRICPEMGRCGGCSPHSLEAKARFFLQHFALPNDACFIYASPDSGYRVRGEFRIYRKDTSLALESSAPLESASLESSPSPLDSPSPLLDSLPASTAPAPQAHISPAPAPTHTSPTLIPPALSLSMNASGGRGRIPIASCPILLPALQLCLQELLPLLESFPLVSEGLYALEVLGARFSTREALAHALTMSKERESKESSRLDSRLDFKAPRSKAPSPSTSSSPAPSPHTADAQALDSRAFAPPPPLDSYQCSDVVISLIYHKRLDSLYEQEARNLLERLRSALDGELEGASQVALQIANLSLIARSKKQKIIITPRIPARAQGVEREGRGGEEACGLEGELVRDVLMVCGKPYSYVRKEGQFCQPNAYMNPSMLSFIKQAIAGHRREDLLEMYGGDGNFSIALAECFKGVFVTEVVKTASRLIARNAALNGVANITSARLSGAETMSALRREREFFRLKGVNLGRFRFSHILIDPPRSGIGDGDLLAFIASFSCIIYISCNLTSLLRDWEILGRSHRAEKLAFFEQFPHTHHGEYALILRQNA